MTRLVFFVAIAVAIALLIWLSRGAARSRSKRRGSARTKGTTNASRADTAALRQRLERLTHDSDVAESLVRAERERFPGLSEPALLRKAIKRLQADRRS